MFFDIKDKVPLCFSVAYVSFTQYLKIKLSYSKK